MKGLLAYASVIANMYDALNNPSGRRHHCISNNVNTSNKLPVFNTNGFITRSINQEAHDMKYKKYLKKKI